MTYLKRLLTSIEGHDDDVEDCLDVNYWATRVVIEWPPAAADEIMSAGADMDTLCAAMAVCAPTTEALIAHTGGGDHPVADWMQSLLNAIYLEQKLRGRA